MTVKTVYEFLNTLFPLDTACDFDNSGLLTGSPDNTITNVLITLDCTEKTVKEAIDNNCNLIITHHPVIFSALKNVRADSVVYRLIQNGISVISLHTNLDIAKNGVSECLCKAIGLSNIASVTAADGFIIKKGEHTPVSASDFADEIRLSLGCPVKYTDSGKMIKNVLVCSGSGGEFITDAVNKGFDALVTADVKHHQFIEAENNGVCLFDAGHFNTEDVVTEPLKALLKNRFPEINFSVCHFSSIKYSF